MSVLKWYYSCLSSVEHNIPIMKTKIDIRRILQVPAKSTKKIKSFDQGLMGLGIKITTKESLK
ncbi:MAG: hypothetical protein RI883_924 [Bacteroidota bacterium]|jgi:adenine-specific DNA glycosylase